MPEKSPLHDAAARRGAEFGEEAGWLVPLRYGDVGAEYRAARERAGLFDLSGRGKVEVAGADAIKFLQNLSTNDVAGLPPGGGCELFLTNAQARVIAYARAYRLPPHRGREAVWLDAAPGLAGKVIQHLDRYIISEDVQLADRTREFAQARLAGPEARVALERALNTDIPDLTGNQHVLRTFGEGVRCPVRRNESLGVPGYDVLCRAAQAPALWEAFVQAGAVPAGRTAYETLRVEAGTPEYGTDMDETNLAPEVGRTRQAICFTKGCFLGQEPLVRIRDLGHVNRSLLALKLEGADAAPRGARVFREDKEVGQVTSSVPSPRLGAGLALAYVRRGHQEPGTRLEVEAGGVRRGAEVIALPLPGGGA